MQLPGTATRAGAARRSGRALRVTGLPAGSAGDAEVAVRFDAAYGRADPAEGERRLLLAVLEEGICTALKHARAAHGRGLRLHREALGWLTSRERRDVFAFESICEALGIDAGRLRQRVLREFEAPARSHPGSPGADDEGGGRPR